MIQLEIKGKSNTVYGKGQDEYLPLPAQKLNNRQGSVKTVWKLSFWERIKLVLWGRLYVTIWTFHNPLQPIRLSVNEDTDE